MDFRILGPLEVLDEGRPITLGGSKQRALLTLLLLHPNETLATDRLIDELWGERPPARAAKTVQMQISRLRKALTGETGPRSAGVVVTRERGYELRLDPDRVDAHRFERLVSEGRSELAGGHARSAVSVLEEALSLWRGAALAELAYEPFAQREIARLDDLRLTAQEQLIEAKLALAGHAEVVGRLEALIAEHPYREGLRAQLMLALYRCDRQAEALQAYQDARRTLVEELGIEPGERLRELERAILAQDPGLHLAVVAEPAEGEAAAQAPGNAFVGRERELAQLVGGLGDAFAGRGRLFLLVGEPGIGKSRLADELIAHAKKRGARVLVGRCWEAGGAPAYWPWTQALRPYVRDSDAAALRAQLGAGAPELAQIVPELRQRFSDLPPPSALEPEGARFRLFDAAVEFLRNACEQRPIVLVLDDLHAADAPSLLLLRFLARELGSTRLFVLVACRDADPAAGQPLTEMLAEVGREPVTRRLALRGLSESEVAEYLELTASEILSPGLAAALHGQSEGNPLFVGEIVRLLAVEGTPSQSPDESRLAIPQSVRDVIARRLGHLSDQCNRVLVLASVLGREFALDVLGRLGGVSDDELLGWLDEASDARIISDVPGSPGRVRFAHVLIRDTLYDGLTSARRLRLHELAVTALEQLNAERPGSHLAELALHSIAAGDRDKALRYARQAADGALELLAYEEAARLFQLALEALGKRPVEPTTRAELLIAGGDAFAKAGSMMDAKEMFLAACDVARNTHLPQIFARAALGYGGNSAWQRAAGDSRLVPLLEEASGALGENDSTLRARLLARLAGALRDEPSLEPRSSLSREAVEIARRLGDKETLVFALTSHFMATWGPDVDGLVAIAEEVGRLAEETGSADAALDALTLKGIVAWLTLADEAETMDTAYDALARQLAQAAPQWQGAMQNALWALFRGDFANAERLEEQALRAGDARSSDADCSHRLAMFILRRAQGRLAEVEDLIRDAVCRYPGYRSFRCLIVLLECTLGHEQEARRAFDELAEADFAALPRDSEWLFCLSILAEVAAYLHDRDRAAVLHRLLAPYARVHAMAAGEAPLGPVARYLGILATTTGRWDEATRYFEDAIVINARVGARPWLAHTQHDYARMLLGRDQPGDHERARELLAAAVSIYRDLGMDSWAEAATMAH
ncbi:MAG TPA: BTAD domain-containing putative transcriptional regulator [Thermoleophilaceae bacterium]|nr:BTAD domain-containing putative transcriptional regulator [Thermoleophilaceae bacterium]